MSRKVWSVLGLLALAACGSKSAPAAEGGAGGDAAGADAAAGSGADAPAGHAGSGGAGGGAAMTPKEACRAAIEALCSRASICYGQKLDECTSPSLYCPDYYFNADSNRTVADIVACLPALRAVTCTDIFMGIFPPCIASGRKPVESLCSFPSQCQSNSCSLRMAGCATCGTGAATVGQSCATAACHGGATCDPQTKLCVDARKTIYAAEGQPCDSDLAPPVGCSGELICLANTRNGHAGTCKKPPGLGEPCGTFSFNERICARGSRCSDGPNGTCVPEDACGGLTCAPGSTCQGGDGGFACVPKVVPRGSGEPCDTQHACAYALACGSGGTCEVAPPMACP